MALRQEVVCFMLFLCNIAVLANRSYKKEHRTWHNSFACVDSGVWLGTLHIKRGKGRLNMLNNGGVLRYDLRRLISREFLTITINKMVNRHKPYLDVEVKQTRQQTSRKKRWWSFTKVRYPPVVIYYHKTTRCWII